MTILKIVLCAIGGFVLGIAVMLLVSKLVSSAKKNKGARRHAVKRKNPISRLGTMNLILILIAAYVFWFTNRMIGIYEVTSGIPDTLVQCVFALLGGECGAMAWIRTTKDKQQDRKWAAENQAKMDAEAQHTASDFEPSYTAEQENRNQ